MSGVGGILCVMLAAYAWQAEEPATEIYTPQAIQQAIEQLGDEQFDVRQKASEFLWRAAKKAEGALGQAIKSDDPEVRYRAALILDKLKLGITPDTPVDVVALIEAYHSPNAQIKQQVIQQLRQKGMYGTLIALYEKEADAALKQNLHAQLRTDANRLLPQAVAAGNFAEAEKWFAFAQLHEDNLLQMAAILQTNGKLGERIAAIQDRLRSPMPQTSDARLLAYLLRASGNLKAARDAADLAKDAVLSRGLALEMGDWEAVIKLHEVIASDSPFNRGRETESLCYLATYQFLAEREADLNQTLEKLVQRFDEKTDDPWQTAETLLLCERFDVALDFLKKWSPLVAAELLRHRQQPHLLLNWLKIAPAQEFTRAWFDELPSPSNSKTPWPQMRFAVGCQAAITLHICGRKDDAAGLFSLLEKLAEEFAAPSEQRSFGMLAEVENNAGLTGLADKHLARSLTANSNVYYLTRILPRPAGAAAWWWAQLRRRSPGDPPEVTLALLRKVLSPTGLAEDDWNRLRDEMELTIATLPAVEQGKAMMFLVETAVLRGEVDEARQLLERYAGEHEPAALRLGDLLARDKRWDEAAAWFKVAAGPAAKAGEEAKPAAVAPVPAPVPPPMGAAPVPAKPMLALPEIQPAQLMGLYLYGWSLAQQGKPEGKEIMASASLRFATAAARHQFALGLQERGLKKEAREQWEIIKQTGPLNSWYTNTAAEHLGNLISGEDPLRASELWRKLTLQLASTNSTLLDTRGYIDLPVTIHRTRAKGFLAAGKNAAALAELAAANRSYPAQTKLTEDFVPLLDKAGLKAEADKFFEEAYQTQAKLCAEFPQSALFQNNLGWMAARCARNLDDALKCATKGVDLAPENAGYLDTLAEVHFQRGEKDKAIAVMKRCLEMEPKRDYFQRQLKRFETGEGTPEE